MHRLKPFCVLCLTLALFACASTGDPTEDWSASRFYSEAKEALQKENYQKAIDYYETLEGRYPFGPYAQQAQLEVAYAYYKFNQPDSAAGAADRFIRLNPLHPHVAYAYYLKGLINFNRDRDLIDRILRNRSERDPAPLRQAFDDFKIVVSNYPDSRYAADARQRMIHMRNLLAEYEMNVADYYMRRGAWVAAINRAQYVLQRHQGAKSIPHALSTMVKAYRKLGLDKLAQDTLRVLRINYPDLAADLSKS